MKLFSYFFKVDLASIEHRLMQTGQRPTGILLRLEFNQSRKTLPKVISKDN